MQQHPIPQNVMSVEFQLVGNLTLRQFGYLAMGGMLCFFIFVAPLPDFLKWPLIALFGIFFAALVWIPINDMSLDRWVVAFFRAINSPTKRIWRKEIKELPIFTQDYTRTILNRAPYPATADRTKLDEYLSTLRASAPKSDLDLAEQAYLQSLPFEEGGPPPPPPAPVLGPTEGGLATEVLPPQKPLAQVLTQPEATPEPRVIEEDLTKPAPLTPAVKPVITVHMPNKNIYVKKVGATAVNRQLHSLSSLEGTIVLPVRGEKTFELSSDLKERLYPEQTIAEVGAAGINPTTPTPPAPPTPPPPPPAPEPVPEPKAPEKTPDFVFKPLPVPEDPTKAKTNVAELEEKLAAEAAAARSGLEAAKPKPVEDFAEPVQPAPIAGAPEPATFAPPPPEPADLAVPDRSQEKVSLPTAPPKRTSSGNVVTAQPAVGKMAPPPANVPNVIVGLVRDSKGLLLTDVVIIVKDADAEPVRALKSNKVGQFAISTPLPNGSYTIDLEKAGFKFDTIAVELNGSVFTPIEVKAS